MRKVEKYHAAEVAEVLEKLKLETANFSRIAPEKPLPTTEKEVDAFIKDRIRNWVNTWVKPPLKEVLEFLERN